MSLPDKPSVERSVGKAGSHPQTEKANGAARERMEKEGRKVPKAVPVRSAIDKALDAIERDRREPDKVICNLMSARRALWDLRERLIERGGCDCTWDIDEQGGDEIVKPHPECPVHV